MSFSQEVGQIRASSKREAGTIIQCSSPQTVQTPSVEMRVSAIDTSSIGREGNKGFANRRMRDERFNETLFVAIGQPSAMRTRWE